MHRRAFLRVSLTTSAAAIGLAGSLPQALAQDYPSRTIQMVVGFAPGGTTDFVARLVGEKMGDILGQRFVVDNKAGAAGAIGTKGVARSDPDGYTVLMGDSTLAITPTLSPSAGIDPLKMLAPVGLVGTFPSVLVAHPSVPASNVSELIAYAKAHPGELNFGSGGIGTVPHLQGELFKLKTGTDIVHVPYKGNAAALQDLLGGSIQMMFAGTPTALAFIQSGQLKLLATTGKERLPIGVDAPTMLEAGIDFVSAQWFGMLAPAGTPPAIVNRLNEALRQATQDPEVAKRLTEQGGFLRPGSPEDFATFIADEVKAWGDIVRAAKVEL
jgi:tripartite-type tricarboxylate transporter receptor subunit TctC